MNWHDKTIQAYDASANGFKDYFASYGPRIEDIQRAIGLVEANNPSSIVEIGCGDGRDAAEIVKRVDFYEGFDPSVELLKLARMNVPNANFVQADALNYNYPQDLTVVFASASLLHVNKRDFKLVFNKVSKSLVSGGIFYISLKEAQEYTRMIKKDQYGERMFYLYTAELIKKIAADDFATVYEDHHVHGNTNWFTMALKKR